MMDFLNHVLSSLAAIPELWQIECLPRAWRSVLLAPFSAGMWILKGGGGGEDFGGKVVFVIVALMTNLVSQTKK